MWSLAVEAQFYLLAPLTLLGLTAATAKLYPNGRQRALAAPILYRLQNSMNRRIYDEESAGGGVVFGI
jgi:peptidoglycan/LPS O-acetylase OafA/YrhL